MQSRANQSLTSDDSVQCWLTVALLLVLAPWVAEAAPVSPPVIPVVAEVTKAIPVAKKARKSKATEEAPTDKTPRKRSPKTGTAL